MYNGRNHKGNITIRTAAVSSDGGVKRTRPFSQKPAGSGLFETCSKGQKNVVILFIKDDYKPIVFKEISWEKLIVGLQPIIALAQRNHRSLLFPTDSRNCF